MNRSVPGRSLAVTVAASVATAGVGWRIGAPTLIGMGPLVAVMAFSEHNRRARLQVRRNAAVAMPTIADQLIHKLRAGHSLGQSCRRLEHDLVSPLREKLEQRRTLVESAQALADGGDPSVRLLAVTLEVLAKNGGSAVPALQRLRHTLVGVANGQSQADAAAAQALASAGLLVVAPSLFALLAAALDADIARFYLSEPLGAGCVFVSVLLSWSGWQWIHRQLAAAQRLEL